MPPSLLTLLSVAACSAGDPPRPPEPYVEAREPCAAADPLRRLFFGDLHIHTSYSFDAHAFDVRHSPEDAYRFARGAALRLPPLGPDGEGTQTVKLSRPLDFAAVTDHSEFLGEVEACTLPGSETYDSVACRGYRQGGGPAIAKLGLVLAFGDPQRDAEICRDDGSVCRGLSGQVWSRVQQAAEAAYDRSAACRFTSFVAYEYSAAPGLSTMHRNVIFRNDRVPPPISTFEQPTAEGLWRELATRCQQAGTGCDVLAIPHNPNESNGRMFRLEYPEGASLAEQRQAARTRAAMEPLVEIYQHKGDSECANALAGPLGAPDEACDFEKPRRKVVDCGDETGTGGTMRSGCMARRDFVRYALLDGLREEMRLGENPLRLGLIASTDTHNATPGATDEDRFIGHRGTDDDTPEKQLSGGGLTPGGIEFSAGGLVGVWAEENSRPSLFDALRRREVMGTSGPRIAVRFFGGWGDSWGSPSGSDAPFCHDPALVRKGYDGGVAMGGVLPAAPESERRRGPAFVISALRDPGDARQPGGKLQVLQLIKGWVSADGAPHYRVIDLAGDRKNGADVDDTTCQPRGPGADSLCAVFRDDAFDPRQPAFYYVRVLENPSCRWSTHTCNALPEAQRPPACSDPSVPRTVQERAWTSPIYYSPGGTPRLLPEYALITKLYP
jgi:hypothetical protein